MLPATSDARLGVEDTVSSPRVSIRTIEGVSESEEAACPELKNFGSLRQTMISIGTKERRTNAVVDIVVGRGAS